MNRKEKIMKHPALKWIELWNLFPPLQNNFVSKMHLTGKRVFKNRTFPEKYLKGLLSS